MHILFQCDFAKTTWIGVGFKQLIQLVDDDDVQAFDVLRKAFQIYTREQCVKIGMLCWSL